ncbi:fungal pheromone STE3G-protein-coupled receptor [Ramaria rubella]|nr:fungal pheromone STE3G-protein-coupled receptor [Ramaria rubella]
MRRPELPIVSFLSIPLLLASLPSHVRAGSVSTIALIAWLGVMSLIRGVNALIWANNFVVRLEVWCDITTKLAVGFTVAVPAAALCILRHLESVASNRSARSTKADKIRRQRFEAIMCFGLPVVFMALHYVVQGHRFDLFEDFGCYPTVYFSIAAIFLVYVPPLALSLTTFVYAAMALRHFMRHRIEFAAHLQNSHSAISASRYFRLMSLAIVEMFWDTGVNIYIIWFNTLTGVRPWISWENVHSNFSRVGIVPEFINPPELVTQLLFQWWIIPVSCIAFFIFFGFGEEAVSDYRGVVTWFRQKILRHRVDIPRRHPNNFGLPTHLYVADRIVFS